MRDAVARAAGAAFLAVLAFIAGLTSIGVALAALHALLLVWFPPAAALALVALALALIALAIAVMARAVAQVRAPAPAPAATDPAPGGRLDGLAAATQAGEAAALLVAARPKAAMAVAFAAGFLTVAGSPLRSRKGGEDRR